MKFEIELNDNNDRLAKMPKYYFCNECSVKLEEGMSAYYCRECRKLYCHSDECIHTGCIGSKRLNIRIVEVDSSE